jgi:hypothetical protein
VQGETEPAALTLDILVRDAVAAARLQGLGVDAEGVVPVPNGGARHDRGAATLSAMTESTRPRRDVRQRA